MKMYAIKISKCSQCPAYFEPANYCQKDMNLGPIEMHEVRRTDGIHPNCPLPDYKTIERDVFACHGCNKDAYHITDDGYGLCNTCWKELKEAQ